MSEIRVDRIVSSSGSGSVEFTQGFTIPEGVALALSAEYASTAGVSTYSTSSGIATVAQGLTGTPSVAVNSLTASNVTINGNLTVDGTTTTVSSVNLVVEDKNIGIGTTTTPSNTTADGGGLTLFGGAGGDKTLNWVNSTSAWTSSEDFNLLSGKVYEINGTTVLSSSQVLGKSVPEGTIVGTTDTQTLSGKTFCSATLTGSLTANGGTGTNGQFLQSTGTGVQWATSSGGAISSCGTTNFISCNTCTPNIGIGKHNFLVGCNAGFSINGGYYNNFFGRCAGSCTTSGQSNNFLGKFAGKFNTTGYSNNFFGAAAGSYNTTGSKNNFFGQDAGSSNTTGNGNIFIGSGSGCRNTFGRYNTFIGAYTGEGNITSCCNTYIGNNSGLSMTGSRNVIIGGFYGTGFTSCSNHIFLSDGAGNNRLQINNSGALGVAGACYGTAGQVLTSCGTSAAPVWTTVSGGSSAIAGCCTSNFLTCNTCATSITSGANNFLFGCNTGFSLTTGNNNTFIGLSAGTCNTFGSYNTFFGRYAGRFNTTGSNNYAAGLCSGHCNSTGSHNIFMGCMTGWRGNGGNDNILLGRCVAGGGSALLSGTDNIGMGCQSLFSLQGGTGNTAIGNRSGRAITSGTHNVIMGHTSGCAITTGNANIIFGHYVAGSLSAGCCNIAIGRYAGNSITNACGNIFLGTRAGCSITGAYNTFIGSFSGTGFTNCSNHIFLSDGAGNNRMQINGSGALGVAGANYGTSGQVLTSNGSGSAPTWQSGGSAFLVSGNSTYYSSNASCFGSDNFFVGCSAGAGFGNPSPQNNIAIGQRAGNYSGACGYTSSYNTFLGFQAGYYRSSGCDNFFAGRCAGRSGFNDMPQTSGSSNVAFGAFAGACLTSGSNNFFAGFCAGLDNTTGSNNIAIGCNSGNDALYDFGTTGGSNIIVMGNNDHTAAYVKVTWTTGSDARDKTNIIPIPVGKDFLKQLNPVQYQWKDRETDEVTVEKSNYGFLAQDILALEDAPVIIVDDHDPDHLKVRESMIVPVLVKTVQELIEEVDTLKEEVRILKGE